jgi:hypothetical protein
MKRRLFVLVGSALAGHAFVLSGLSAAPAAAHTLAAPTPTPSPAPIKAVELSGDGLQHPIILFSDKHPQRHNAMRGEVEWLAGKGTPAPVPSGEMGPKFSLTLFNAGAPTDRFDLYPLAAGGPRVFRPADQPGNRKVAEAWFYGRLSMPSSLLAAGVPLAGVTPDPVIGGQAGGLYASEPPDLRGMLGQWSRFMGLNVAAIVILAAGVFAIAYVIRKRV